MTCTRLEGYPVDGVRYVAVLDSHIFKSSLQHMCVCVCMWVYMCVGGGEWAVHGQYM